MAMMMRVMSRMAALLLVVLVLSPPPPAAAQGSWDLEYVSSSVLLEPGTVNEVFLEFNQTVNRTSEIKLMDVGCTNELTDDPPAVSYYYSKESIAGSSSHEYLEVYVDIDTTTVAGSSIWVPDGGSNAKGNITFCVRVELLSGSSVSVSFREVDIVLIVDLSENVFNLAGTVEADAVDATEDEVAQQYGIEAYQCRGSFDETPLADPLRQNEAAEVCVRPNSTEVKIDFCDLSLYQQGVLVTDPVLGGMPTDSLTAVETGSTSVDGSDFKVFKMRTFMISQFFDDIDTDPSVTINGTCSMVFDTAPLRSLRLAAPEKEGEAEEEEEEEGRRPRRKLQDIRSNVEIVFPLERAQDVDEDLPAPRQQQQPSAADGPDEMYSAASASVGAPLGAFVLSALSFFFAAL